MGFDMGLTGHTFGVRVQAPFGARVQKVQRVQKGRFLRWMGLWPRGLRIALRAMLMKSALRDLPFCIIHYEKHYVDQPPPVAFPPLVPYGTTFPPLSGGTIKL